MSDTFHTLTSERRADPTESTEVLAEVQLDRLPEDALQAATVGVPIARGSLKPGTSVAWRSADGTEQHCQSRVLSHWPDGSVRWLLCDWLGYRGLSGPQYLELIPGSVSPPEDRRVTQRTAKTRMTLDAGCIQLHGDPSREAPLSVTAGPATKIRAIRLTAYLRGRGAVAAQVEEVETPETGPLRGQLIARGAFPGTPLMFRIAFTLRAESTTLEGDLRIVHGGAAAHPGGCWDLGDKNSCRLDKIALEFELPDSPAHQRYSLDGGGSFVLADGEPLEFYQASSGGVRWNAMNHQTGKARVDLPFRGFRLCQGSKVLEVGHRPDAWLSCAAPSGGWANLRVRRLWENFPIGLRTTPAGLAADFLAAPEEGEATELQGGEAKSYSFDVSFADEAQSLAALAAPATLRVFPKSIAAARVLPYLYRKELPGPWSRWLDGIVDGEQSFFSKRERADEFGWRHFGDLFADHEAIHTPAESPLASHYNNQYDPLLSLLRQYLVRGDRRWFELADDLARHLRDIDIYNTDEDREEYNGGMFWHTDHYLDAGTCSHRSYSAAHAEIKGAAGGGPSLEHCYSQGLAHHYFISGNRESRDAVLQLARWVIRVNRGPSTLLGSFYKLRRQKEPLKAWLRRQKPSHYRCPFNRASGNSLHTLLDAFLVTEDREYLVHADWLIRNCAGPEDDPNSRDLLNAEANWSYTVFLDALARYLGVLEQLDDLREQHAYGASILALYADWMIDHEINYLDRRDQLEFPNETWPAQDLRKARVILRACSYLPEARVEPGRARAIHLFDRAIEQLQEFPEEKRALTRPMILLLQNYEAVVSLRGAEISSVAVPAAVPGPVPTFGDYLREQFAYALRRTSIGKELRWVRTRILHARA